MILATAIAFDLLRPATGQEVSAIEANTQHLMLSTECMTSAIPTHNELCILRSWNGIPLWGLTRLGPVEDYFVNPDFLGWRPAATPARTPRSRIPEAGFDCIAIVCSPSETAASPKAADPGRRGRSIPQATAANPSEARS